MKIKKTLLTLGLTGMTVAPIVATSCGAKKAPKKPVFTGDTPEGNVSLFPENIKNAQIKDFDDSQLDKTPYSLDTLRAEAQKINDDAVWTAGIGPTAFQSAISIVRALASAYGYENPDANGISQKDLFFQNVPDDSSDTKKSKFDFIDDTKAPSVLADPNASMVKKLLASFTYNSKTPSDHYMSQMYIGDTGFDPHLLDYYNVWTSLKSDQFKYVRYGDRSEHNDVYGFFVDKNKDGKIDDQGDDDRTNDKFHPLAVWDDFTVSMQRDMLLAYSDGNDKIYREIKMPNFLDTSYPVIEKTEFEQNYVPYVQATLANLLKIFTDTTTMSLIGGFGGGELDINLLIDQISFIISKNIDADNNVDFTNDSFINHLEKINENGTQHFLALKAFYKGFDASFASGRALAFSLINQSTLVGWDLHQPLEGLAALSEELKQNPDDTLTKIKIMKGDGQYFENANGDEVPIYGFRADKTIDELYTQLGVTDAQKAIVDATDKQ